MRIIDPGDAKNREIRAERDKKSSRSKKGESSSAGGASFHEVFAIKKEEIEEGFVGGMIGEIERLGDTMEKEPHLRNFLAYRDAVRRLVRRVVPNAFEVTSSLGRVNPRTGDQKQYHIVNTVNAELESLLSYFREKEADRFKIASSVIKIKGLIVDLTR